MATSFAAQLSQIAATSTHELDLRARRNLHAESLLFPRDVAAKQSFDVIYTICLEGFRDLCQVDARFADFSRNLFSVQAKEQDREQMTRSENEALDAVIERVLVLLGRRILLNPAVRMLEWLVRRFKVHVYNTSSLVLMLLPYHETSIWRNVISIIPANKLAAEWKWTAPYKSDSLNVPRHAIVHALTNNDGFWTRWNQYVISATRDGMQHGSLMKFWNGTVVEAVVGRLTAARSGRKEVQQEKMQTALLKILPLLSDGFEVRDCPDMTTALLTVAMVLAAKAELDDRVLDSLLQTISALMGPNDAQTRSIIITSANLISQKQIRTMPRPCLDAFRNLPRLEERLQGVAPTYSVDALVQGLVAGSLSSISSKKRNSVHRISFVDNLVHFCSTLNDHTLLKFCLKQIIVKAFQLSSEDDGERDLRSGLLQIAQLINEEGKFAHVLSEAAIESNQSREELEALIEGTLTLMEVPSVSADAMETDAEPSNNSTVQDLLNRIPSRTADVSSFLAKYDEQLFEDILRCFEQCCKRDQYIPQFLALPIWSSATSGRLLLFSFLMRVGVCGPSAVTKTIAITLLARSIEKLSDIDVQTIIPYALTALSDASASSVRQAAAELILAITNLMVSSEDSEQFGKPELYDHASMQLISWAPSAQLLSVLQQALLPNIEECVLDASVLARVVESAMNGPSQSQPEGVKLTRMPIRKGAGRSLLDVIASHAVATPILIVKLSMITLLSDVQKVGTTSKTLALTPVLDQWISYNELQATNAAGSEGLDLNVIDETIANIMSSSTKDAPGDILSILGKDIVNFRAEFTSAIFARLQKLWNELKHSVQVSVALKLFDLSFIEAAAVSRGAQGVLQSVMLSTDALGAILEQTLSGITQMQTEEQPKKRRRTSHGRENLPPDLAKAIDEATSRLTFSLELVEASGIDSRPELLAILFETLALLKRLKQQQRVQSPYLHHLCLSNLSSIVDSQLNLPKPSIDFSSIRADLVTDCIQNSESIQVQNTALLLAASLASLAPDKMLHNVMPIFTFMGQHMFAKEDDHSIHVISQAINQIIPALFSSLRKQNKDIIKSTSGILSSFAAAFDHIPQDRRVSIYQQLLSSMNTADFAFVLIAILAVRREADRSFINFLADLMSELPTLTQLVTYRKLLDLAADVKSQSPNIAQDMFDLGGSDIVQCDRIYKQILETALHISQLKNLTTAMKKMYRVDEETRIIMRNETISGVRRNLSLIRDARIAGYDGDFAKKCLDALLTLPPLSELFSMTPSILLEMDTDEALKPQILRILALQLERDMSKDAKTRRAAIELLAVLTRLLDETHDVALRQAAIVAVDKISEAYGRKDANAALMAAKIISGDSCFQSDNRRVRIMSILCLASMFEVLKEASAPIVSDVIGKMINSIRENMEQQDEEMYRALNSLMSAVVSHVSFLILDNDLEALIVACNQSAQVYTSKESTDSRLETLTTIARKVDLSALLGALQKSEGHNGAKKNTIPKLESLDLLLTAIGAASKAQVIINADTISQFLLAQLDYRRQLAHDPEAYSDIADVESKIKEVAVQYIYKLNDTTFRPIFESWVDWAIKSYDITGAQDIGNAQRLRQTSLFILLNHFFSTLQSIVTSYASYIITPASTILEDVAVIFESSSKRPMLDQVQLNLYISLLDVLRATFAHDADGFFATPSHFDPLGPTLVRQLHLASSKQYRNKVEKQIIPTIVALATAVTDTPFHHQTISHNLTSLRRSSSAGVRLASIQTLSALSMDEDVGDDFIANTIGVGSAAMTDGDGMGIARGGGSSAGELMIYVNEMLEDDDEDVEMEVRKWVQGVREKVGEDVFEV